MGAVFHQLSKCSKPHRRFSLFFLAISKLYCRSLHLEREQAQGHVEPSLIERHRLTGTFVPQTCRAATSMVTAGLGRSGLSRGSATATALAMGSICQTACLTWKTLLEATLDRDLALIRTLTSGSWRGWAQAAQLRA